eukprot:1186366-Prorocentrum_minimum.AAC.1
MLQHEGVFRGGPRGYSKGVRGGIKSQRTCRGCTSQPCCSTSAFPTAMSLLLMMSFMPVTCGAAPPIEGSANLCAIRPRRLFTLALKPVPCTKAVIAFGGSASEAMFTATATCDWSDQPEILLGSLVIGRTKILL